MTWANPVQALLAGHLFLYVLLPGVAGGATGAQQTSETFDAVVASAAAARDNHDIPQAIQLYRRAEQLNPRWVSGWWSLGLLQYSIKLWPDARSSFTHYIELSPVGSPAIAQATALRGLCEFEISDFPDSFADLDQSLKLGGASDPQSATLLRLREAQVLTRLSRFDEALEVYSSLARAVSPDRRGPEWNLEAGLAGLRSPQPPANVPLGQQNLFAAAGDAALRLMAGDEAGGRQAFAAFFQRFPDAYNAHFLYGSLISPNDPEGAVTEYKRELQIAPKNAIAAAMLARVLLYQGKPAQALVFAQRAEKEDPDSAVAQLVLGRSLAETGDLTAGIAHLEKSLQLQPAYLETHIALAVAYSGSGRHEDARRERLQSLSMAEAYRAGH